MNEQRHTWRDYLGASLIAWAVLPAFNQAGFGSSYADWSLKTCLVFAMIGCAVGGALMAHKHWVAGFFGGLVAGPCGFLTLYFYLLDVEDICSFEYVAILQVAGSLPGIGLYYLLKRLGPADSPADETEGLETR